MPKLIQVKSVLLIVASSFAVISWVLASLSFPALSTSSELTVSQNDQKNKSIAERLADVFRRRPRQGGTQGEFCSISPSIESRLTWSERPLFVWQGNVTQIEVHRRGSQPALLWTDVLTEQEQSKQSRLYEGPTLVPGQKYEYLVTYKTTDEGQIITNTKKIPFEVLEAEDEKRHRIEAKLAILENQNQTMSAEELALQRAEYFAEENLWLDVIREVLLLPNQSSNWARAVQEYQSEQCK
jgi:hypothetical protein